MIYKDSLLASGAEKVLLADHSQLGNLTLPDGDFWIFDGSSVLQWEYENGNGKLTGGEVWGAGEDISYFLDLQEKLMVVATPVV